MISVSATNGQVKNENLQLLLFTSQQNKLPNKTFWTLTHAATWLVVSLALLSKVSHPGAFGRTSCCKEKKPTLSLHKPQIVISGLLCGGGTRIRYQETPPTQLHSNGPLIDNLPGRG